MKISWTAKKEKKTGQKLWLQERNTVNAAFCSSVCRFVDLFGKIQY